MYIEVIFKQQFILLMLKWQTKQHKNYEEMKMFDAKLFVRDKNE